MFIESAFVTVATCRLLGRRFGLTTSARSWALPYAIGGLASFWVIDRTAAFFA